MFRFFLPPPAAEAVPSGLFPWRATAAALLQLEQGYQSVNERADSTSSPATSHGGIDERADLLVVDAPLGEPDGEWGEYIAIRGDDWGRSRVCAT